MPYIRYPERPQALLSRNSHKSKFLKMAPPHSSRLRRHNNHQHNSLPSHPTHYTLLPPSYEETLINDMSVRNRKQSITGRDQAGRRGTRDPLPMRGVPSASTMIGVFEEPASPPRSYQELPSAWYYLYFFGNIIFFFIVIYFYHYHESKDLEAKATMCRDSKWQVKAANSTICKPHY